MPRSSLTFVLVSRHYSRRLILTMLTLLPPSFIHLHMTPMLTATMSSKWSIKPMHSSPTLASKRRRGQHLECAPVSLERSPAIPFGFLHDHD